MNTTLKNYIINICAVQKIEPPKVQVNPKKILLNLTGSTLAMYVPEDNTVYLKQDNISPDLLFSIAHELRHVWQWRTDQRKYFDNYKSSSELGIVDYNRQPAEMDAHAFATRIMIDNFGMKPLFNGFPDELKNEIYSEAERQRFGVSS